jgi:hypothetical protein
MWFRAAATTTHGNHGFSRQCVCGQEYVNFLTTFSLRKRMELSAGEKVSRAADFASFPLGQASKSGFGSPSNQHLKTGYRTEFAAAENIQKRPVKGENTAGRSRSFRQGPEPAQKHFGRVMGFP